MSDQLAVPFKGATHRNAMTGEPVKGVRWVKDGAHPAVQRYPVEGRAHKGILIASEKERFGLRFGDWVIEDVRGRLWVVTHERFAIEYVALEEQPA